MARKGRRKGTRIRKVKRHTPFVWLLCIFALFGLVLCVLPRAEEKPASVPTVKKPAPKPKKKVQPKPAPIVEPMPEPEPESPAPEEETPSIPEVEPEPEPAPVVPEEETMEPAHEPEEEPAPEPEEEEPVTPSEVTQVDCDMATRTLIFTPDPVENKRILEDYIDEVKQTYQSGEYPQIIDQRAEANKELK